MTRQPTPMMGKVVADAQRLGIFGLIYDKPQTLALAGEIVRTLAYVDTLRDRVAQLRAQLLDDQIESAGVIDTLRQRAERAELVVDAVRKWSQTVGGTPVGDRADVELDAALWAYDAGDAEEGNA